ncbi:DUF202 domain-containing protein [Thioclava sp. BHET1]|nr:DUF202 domain-containing protein [Thioclava sp. BHET1]
MTERLIPGIPGLQPERTDLSWLRAALLMGLDGGLLLLREGGRPGLLSLWSGSFALALACMMILIGCRRSRLLRLRPLPVPLAARQEVLLTGLSIAALAALTGGMILMR